MHSRNVGADIMLAPPLQGVSIGAQGPLSIPSLGKGVYEDAEVAGLHRYSCGLPQRAWLRVQGLPGGVLTYMHHAGAMQQLL